MPSIENRNPIPTNIITGFLGVGKTTVIRHLLEQKPADERWAVLVNEFGEVGIDSNLFAEGDSKQRGVTISQVPGGCMCCANGLPMQMALNLLLAKSKPHRLLIEPTGLGHPKEVLAILTGQYYRDVLALQATLTLVDSRKIQDERYTTNSTFNEQLEIAEVIVANKSDLYEAGDFPALLDYIETQFGIDSKLIYQVQHGAVELKWLRHAISDASIQAAKPLSASGSASTLPATIEVPPDGCVRKDNQGEGFFSRGWVFGSDWLFDDKKLLSVFHGMDAERMKGVFKTAAGYIGLNKTEDVISQTSIPELADSRVEVISDNPDTLEGVEEALLACVIADDSVDGSNGVPASEGIRQQTGGQ